MIYAASVRPSRGAAGVRPGLQGVGRRRRRRRKREEEKKKKVTF